jgi:hypothetical protein
MEEKNYKENHVNVFKILNLKDVFFEMFCQNILGAIYWIF